MLLTRSRLCPGASPGSSLHLHVLSTPPAFVLSQDQTLREELLSESCQCITQRVRPYTWPRPDAIDEVLFQVCRTARSAAGVDEPGRIRSIAATACYSSAPQLRRARLARQRGVDPPGERAKLDCPLGSLAPGSVLGGVPSPRGATVFENSTACTHDSQSGSRVVRPDST